VEEKIIAVLFSLLILAQAGTLRMVAGSWIVPGCLFGLFWFGYTFIPLVALWNVPINNPWAIFYIFSCCTIFSLPGYFFHWRSVFRERLTRPAASDYNTPVILFSFYTVISLSVLCMLIDLSIQGVTLTAALTQPLAIANEMIARRYENALLPNIFAQFGIFLQYPAIIFGALVFASRNSNSAYRLFLLSLIFMPSVLEMVLKGAKGTLFLGMALFWGSLLVCKIRQGESRLVTANEIRKLVPYSVLVLGLLTAGFLSRFDLDASHHIDFEKELTRLLASYAMAHLYSFSDWFSYYIGQGGSFHYDDDLGQYGFYTFLAVAKLLWNGIDIPSGTYEEYFIYQDILQTNIYTMFRGLIVDYGLLGSFIFLLILSVFFNFANYFLIRLKHPAFAVAIFVIMIAFFYSSALISLFTWLSPIFTMLVVAIVLVINNLFLSRHLVKNSDGEC